MELAVGEPWLGSLPDGGFDVLPLLVSVGLLTVARAGFRIAITWPVAVLALLAGPLLVALADRIGAPLTAGAVTLALAATARARGRTARRHG